ncbi:MAG: PLP-dependent aminotransferase family protein [Candidatus Sedimenticola sp. PURPLELP]
MKKYEQLADRLKQQIQKGIFHTGEKLPSIRHLSGQYKVSISTVQEAFYLLEAQGIVEARLKSGHYVRGLPDGRPPSPPRVPEFNLKPQKISKWLKVLNVLFRREEPGITYLGRATPNVRATTLKPLNRSLAALTRRGDERGLSYDYMFGCEELRQQIARISVDSGCGLSPHEVVITSGCLEALSSCVRALTKPGDTVIVDSPSFYGSLQVIEANGLKTIEMPADPQTGVSLEAMELALDKWPVKVCLLTPTFNNPLGYCMPDERKEALLKLLKRYEVPLIEDDIFGDLAYDKPRPRTIKSFDREGRVLLCSSFSKTLAPGLRVGWVAPGRYLQEVMHMKYVSSMGTATFPQLAVADFIATGGYDRHLKRIRSEYRQGRDRMLEWIKTYFPENTRVSCPKGGFLLWLELPENVNGEELTTKAMEAGIGIASGNLFSATDKFDHHIRLSYASAATHERELAVRRLGELICEMSG